MVRVLIIEDDAVAALDIQSVLASAGATSFSFADGLTEALACARADRPRLITSDVMLSRDFGPEVVAQVIAAVGEVPVLYITGSPENCGPVPPDQVFEKPFDAARLRAAARAVLSGFLGEDASGS